MFHVKHPDLLALLILALGTFRLIRLVAYDEITVDARRWITGISDAQHKEYAQWVESRKAAGFDPWDDDGSVGTALADLVSERRYYWSKLVRCPWCIGFWISVGVWLVWTVEPRVTLWLLVPFVLSAAGGLIAKQLDP
jgi:hypothetical protein